MHETTRHEAPSDVRWIDSRPGTIRVDVTQCAHPAFAQPADCRCYVELRHKPGLWEHSAKRYREALRKSWREHPAAWQRVLSAKEVWVVCYCVAGAERCYRSVMCEVLGKVMR
jgi:hypothetical protein